MQIEYATVFTQNPLNEMGEPQIIANGNAAAVVIIDKNTEYDFSSDKQRQKLATLLLSKPQKYFDQNSLAPSAVCFIDKPIENSVHPSIECFSAYAKIITCGHGLLAANAILNQHRQTKEQAGQYRYAKNLHWIKMTNIKVNKSTVPDWADKVFSIAPSHAAYTGNIDSATDQTSDGYWIFEWPSQPSHSLAEQHYQLQQLSVNHAVLKQLTQRAIIATQWLDTNKYNLQFLQRYFAPQYGVNEDGATGSAHRVLASYWAKKTTPTESLASYSAYQCSTAGGVLHSKLVDDAIWLGGRVDIGSAVNLNIRSDFFN
jgi:predicted PhzF superfamily epimerase YddE/YHI9